MKLLSISSDAKTIKGQKKGYLTGILYLAPMAIGGRNNVCPMASKGCSEACLYTAGRARIFSAIQEARIRKTQLFFDDRTEFMRLLRKDVSALVRKAERENLTPCVRLNGTSDLLPNDYIQLMHEFSEVQFYDYTKVFNRLNKNLPKNYNLTFSRSEVNQSECLQALSSGYNVAIVFDELPKFWHNFEVINGDESDVRFIDERSVVVGLSAKGDAKKDASGFVVRGYYAK